MNEKTFHDFVDKNGPGGCWIWTGGKQGDGYGNVAIKIDGQRKTMLAHRYSWMLHYGKEPVHQANHKCDNRACVNPEHLYDGTQQDNIKDMDARGRRGSTPGQLNPRAKLSPKDILKIRSLWKYREFPQSKIAKMFGITQSYVSYILLRKSWKSI